MKVSKISRITYGIFMLLPFIIGLAFMLAPIFSHTFDWSQVADYKADGYKFFAEGLDDGIYFYLNWLGVNSSSNFYGTIYQFVLLITGGSFDETALFVYMVYGIQVSLFYLGYEVLLAFINIARKLVYAFVDKEF